MIEKLQSVLARWGLGASAAIAATVLFPVIWNVGSFASVLIAILFVATMLAILRKNCARAVFWSGFPAMVVAQLCCGYFLMVNYGTWDVWVVTRHGLKLALGEEIFRPYFALYPNNIAIMLLFALIHKAAYAFFGIKSLYTLVFANIVVVDLSILLAVCLMRRLLGAERGWMVGVMMLFYLPLYLYVPICYTDTFCMPFALGGMLTAVRVVDAPADVDWRRQVAWTMLSGLLFFAAFLIKGSCVVFWLAAMVFLAITASPKRILKGLLVWLAVGVVGLLVWQAAIAHLIPRDLFERYKFPATHWIMMGLNAKGGGYNQEDVNYTKSAGDYKAKQKAVAQRISERVSDFGLVGLLAHVQSKAVKHCWNYGTCYAERYLGDYGDKPRRVSALHQFVLTRGRYHAIVTDFSMGIYIAIFVLAWLHMVRGCVVRDTSAGAMFAYALVGGMLFFMLWETHPRYSLHFMPMMFLLAGSELARCQRSDRRE